MDCIPELIPSFLIVSYRETGERFLKRSYDLLHFPCIAGLANVNASMRSFCDIYCFKRSTIIFWEGDEKSRKRIVCKSKKAEINCSQTLEEENKKFAD